VQTQFGALDLLVDTPLFDVRLSIPQRNTSNKSLGLKYLLWDAFASFLSAVFNSLVLASLSTLDSFTAYMLPTLAFHCILSFVQVIRCTNHAFLSTVVISLPIKRKIVAMTRTLDSTFFDGTKCRKLSFRTKIIELVWVDWLSVPLVHWPLLSYCLWQLLGPSFPSTWFSFSRWASIGFVVFGWMDEIQLSRYGDHGIGWIIFKTDTT
jgi:hypothetical protein